MLSNKIVSVMHITFIGIHFNLRILNKLHLKIIHISVVQDTFVKLITRIRTHHMNIRNEQNLFRIGNIEQINISIVHTIILSMNLFERPVVMFFNHKILLIFKVFFNNNNNNNSHHSHRQSIQLHGLYLIQRQDPFFITQHKRFLMIRCDNFEINFFLFPMLNNRAPSVP